MPCTRIAFRAADTALFERALNGFDMNSSQQLTKVSNITFIKSTFYVFLAMPFK
jgi:hypothetical protein